MVRTGVRSIAAQDRDAAADRLRDAGLRITAQRVAVLQALLQSSGHPTVQEIYQRVRRHFPMISLNTVYKTLNVLRERGELAAVGDGEDGAIRFESNPTPHHHVVCLGCRRIQDVLDPAIDALHGPSRLGGGFAVIGHRIEFFGYCRQCRKTAGSPRLQASGRLRAPVGRGRRTGR